MGAAGETRIRVGVNDAGWGGPRARAGRDPEGAFSTERFFDEATAAGYEGIELSPGTLADFGGDVSALRDALARRSLTVSGAITGGHLEGPDTWPTLERHARLPSRWRRSSRGI